jgi:hypothetical protein
MLKESSKPNGGTKPVPGIDSARKKQKQASLRIFGF